MSTAAAQLLANRRKIHTGGHNGGRPKQPTKCARCGLKCPGAREAAAHCRKKRT